MKYTKDQRENILLETQSLLEMDTSRSIDAERVLEMLINMQNVSKQKLQSILSDKKDDRAKFLINYHSSFLSKQGTPLDVYYGAIAQIKKLGIHPSAIQVGSKSFQTTNTWKKYGGISMSTSKSDVITLKTTYSVKNASEQIRVLDASIPQLTALINYSIDTVGVSDSIQKIVKTSINKMKKLQSEEAFAIKREIDKETGKKLGLAQMRNISNKRIKAMIEKFDENSRQMNVALTSAFNAATKNPKFKSAFIRESISGKVMFGSSSEARAESILTWSTDLKNIHVHGIQKVTNSILESFTMPKIMTKTSGGALRISKTFQAYHNVKEHIDTELKKFDKLIEEENYLLSRRNSGLITEGIFMDLWYSIKDKGIEIINKIIDFIGNWLDKATQAASDTWNAALEFLGIEIDILEYDEYANKTYGSL